LPLAFSLLFRRQWPSVYTDPGALVGAMMEALVARAAKGSNFAVPELLIVAVVGLDVVNGVGWSDQPLGKAKLAQGLVHELASSAPAPATIVIGAAPIVAALAATLAVEAGERIGAHGADAGTDGKSAKDRRIDNFANLEGELAKSASSRVIEQILDAGAAVTIAFLADAEPHRVAKASNIVSQIPQLIRVRRYCKALPRLHETKRGATTICLVFCHGHNCLLF
jgi:hypothetical protein